MTGFLRRLATGTLHAESALHPDVGSVWTAPRTLEPIESFSEMSVSPRRDGNQSPPPTQPISDKSVEARVPPHRTVPPRAESKLIESLNFAPLIAPSQSITLPSSRASASVDQNEARTISDSSPAFEPAAPVLPRSEAAPPPLVSPRVATLQPTGKLVPTTFRGQSLEGQRAEEPDAIEIHIGRIEVLAAPPPPSQPSPRPAPKSLNLGEYLGRDRRVR